MDRSEVVKLYDKAYPAEYEGRFLIGPWVKVGSDFEASVPRPLIGEDSMWRDVGCGTGRLRRRLRCAQPGV